MAYGFKALDVVDWDGTAPDPAQSENATGALAFDVATGRLWISLNGGPFVLMVQELVVASPAALNANTDDWSPTGFADADIVRVQASVPINLTGLDASGLGRKLRKTLINVGTQSIALINGASASQAANRLLFPYPNDMLLYPDHSIQLFYDAASARWRSI